MIHQKLATAAIVLTVVAPVQSGDLPALGPDSKIYRGQTSHINDLCNPFPGCQAPQVLSASDKNVLGLIVDTNDHRYTGSQGDLTTYRDEKHALYEQNMDEYWDETSWGLVGVELMMPDAMHSMSGAFDDYYNRAYAQTSLTTSGVSLPLDGSVIAVIHVRDANGRNKEVTFDPTANFMGELEDECQEIFDAVDGVPSSWIICESTGSELRISLVDDEVAEATFIRVALGNDLEDLGMEGPVEEPHDEDASTTARITSKPVPGGFPLMLTSGFGEVTFEIRNKASYPITRRYTIPYPDKTYATPQDLVEDLFLPVLNDEFNWVSYFDAGADRFGVELNDVDSGDNAAIRVVGGSMLDLIGVDGPTRVDGVVTEDKTRTVRGDRSDIVAEALSLFIAARAEEENIPIVAASEADLDDLVDAELDGYDSFLILLVDEDIDPDLPSSRRAGASSSAWFDIEIPGEEIGYVYENQKNAGFMIGPGYITWQTWAHELGHTLGFTDLYAKSQYSLGSMDFINDWGLMNSSGWAPHVIGWHKLRKGTWLPGNAVKDVGPPDKGVTEIHKFTLVPLEYRFGDYAGVGDNEYPEAQLIRILLSDHHWVMVENRQPGVMFSQNLPDDVDGAVPPVSAPGGLLVTDDCDTDSDFACLSRPKAHNLNPHGTANNARGIGVNESWDLFEPDANPGYDGIVVFDVGAIPGPAGKPDARRVEIEWGPGDFVELEIRPWHSPDVYATEDIWIDWPGNDIEDYPNDPPLGSGDDVHWHPDGTVKNLLKVRVHNRGTVLAEDVVVRGLVNTPGGVGDKGDFVTLGDSDPQNIEPGGHKDFEFEWYPTDGEHTCVRAEIVSHDSALGDIDLTNNEAQENLWDFYAESSSPYDPIVFDFKLNSDFAFPVDVQLTPSGLEPGIDLELERNQFHLEPDESVVVQGRFTVDVDIIPPELISGFHRINIHALLETEDAYLTFGGATIDLHAGYASSIELQNAQCSSALGQPFMAEGMLFGQNNAFQPVEAAIVASDGLSYGATGVTDAAGQFFIDFFGVPQGPGTLMLYYFGPLMTASASGPWTILVPCSPPAPEPVPPTLTVGVSPVVPDALAIQYDTSQCNAADHAIVYGRIGEFSLVTEADCSVGNNGGASVIPPSGDVWFLITGVDNGTYSSLGQSSTGERNPSGIDTVCPAILFQNTAETCP